MDTLSIMLISFGGVLSFAGVLVMALYDYDNSDTSALGFLADLWLLGGAITMLMAIVRGVIITMTNKSHPVFPAGVVMFVGLGILTVGLLVL